MSSLRTADAFESGRRFSPSGGREVMTGNASAVRRLWYVIHTWNILLVEKIKCS